MRLTCPAVLRGYYESGGYRRELLLAFALASCGDHVVGLRMDGCNRPSWSGWRGRWRFCHGLLYVFVHFAGDEQRLVSKQIELKKSVTTEIVMFGKMWDRRASVIVEFYMKTLVFTQMQLGDIHRSGVLVESQVPQNEDCELDDWLRV